ncbi:MAG: hypothetical protein IJN79_04780 [Clostridia bacterium]|nr:hypothetical protein [Clostridia bacterium]MBQ6857908.1 hypothetical protein [Clostridia bacterium]MBQ7052089.1 hypothetical protein [Clostridia bacterium]
MEWIRLIGFCLLAAVMVMLLRQVNSAMAGLLSAAFGVLVLSLVLPQIKQYIDAIQAFLVSLELEGRYYAIMLKAMGVVLVTQMAVQVCIDLDAPMVARRAELCGRAALLGVAVPVFMELTELAVGALR